MIPFLLRSINILNFLFLLYSFILGQPFMPSNFLIYFIWIR